jgi:hypothetical protein
MEFVGSDVSTILPRRLCLQCALVVCATTLVGCERAVRRDPVIDRYKAAECVPRRIDDDASRVSRAWRHTMTTRTGVAFTIEGFETGGRVDLLFLPAREQVVAAEPGDYIYPNDVRFDQSSKRLYVKAAGQPASSFRNEAWLFEYDVKIRKLLARLKVAPDAMPAQ